MCNICKQSNHKLCTKNGKCAIKCFKHLPNEKKTIIVEQLCTVQRKDAIIDTDESNSHEIILPTTKPFSTTNEGDTVVIEKCVPIQKETHKSIHMSAMSPVSALTSKTEYAATVSSLYRAQNNSHSECDLDLLPNGSVYKNIYKGYWWINDIITPSLTIYQFIPNKMHLNFNCPNKHCFTCENCYELQVTPKAFVSSVKKTNVDDALLSINEKKAILKKWKVFLGI